jgi:hypothetical protein
MNKHIGTWAHEMINLQLERHAWISRGAAQIEARDCLADSLCRCRKCRPGYVERKWA